MPFPRPVPLLHALLATILALVICLQARYASTLLNGLAHGDRRPERVADVDPVRLTLTFLHATLQKAGARAGDRLLAVDGRAVESRIAVAHALLHRSAREHATLTLRRGQDPPFHVQLSLPPSDDGQTSLEELAEVLLIGLLTPWFCLALGFLVVLRRPTDPSAIALFVFLWAVSRIFRTNGYYELGWSSWFTIPSLFLDSALFTLLPLAWLCFGVTFPDPRSPHRLLPWARWLLGVPIGLLALLNGVVSSGLHHAPRLFVWLTRAYDPIPAGAIEALQGSALALGIANLLYKRVRETRPDIRRKLRVLLAGMGLGFAPLLGLFVASYVLRRSLESFGQGALTAAAVAVILVPATMAYVVVVQRAMDLGIVVRQGLQYAFAASSVAIIQAALVVALFWLTLLQATQPGWRRLAAIVGCVAGILLVRRGAEWLRRRLDRRFFREAVDAEQVLHDLSEEVHRIVDPQTLLRTVSERIAGALHVPRVAALVAENGDFRPAITIGYGEEPLAGAFPAAGSVAERLRTAPGPVLVDPRRTDADTAGDRELLQQLDAELLLPLTVKGNLLGLLSLSSKRSEQPYSAADLRLLQSVSTQAGLALENSRLAAAVAEEAAHRERIHRELEIAREVQQRLFPKVAPHVQGLQLAGACRPAQSVGGDYYDFLVTPFGEIGLAVGDVSGKGVPAALLMASLQASLRALTAAGISNLSELMATLNRLIYDATPASRFATFFYGLYDPGSGRLRFSSAGHNPALLLRASGEVVWLKTRGVGLGLARGSRYQEASTTLLPGDRLILYTDGVTEAMSPAQEEFGEDRLVAAAQTPKLDAAHLQNHLLQSVTAFTSTAPQHDDITFLIALRESSCATGTERGQAAS